MKKRQVKWHIHIIVILAVAAALCTGYGFSRRMEENLTKEMRETLQDIGEQNVQLTNQEISDRFCLLNGLAELLQQNPGNERTVLADMSAFRETYSFKRMGYLDETGRGWTTDGYQADLAGRPYFEDGMQGKNCLSATLDDYISGHGEQINVFSVPVYDTDGETVKGVLFATYANEKFSAVMDVEFFEDRGYICLVTSDGSVVAHSPDSPIEEARNFFNLLAACELEDGLTVDAVRANLATGRNGQGRCRKGDSRFLFYYTPLDEELQGDRWYIVTMASQEVLDERLAPIVDQVNGLLSLLFAISIVVVAVYLLLNLKSKRELESLAYTDTLTGGYNYACFKENAAQYKGKKGYFIAMDISEFKAINSICGVAKGDETLLAVWKTLLAHKGPDEIIARVSADRFVLFLQYTERSALEERIKGLFQELRALDEILHIPHLYPVFGIYETNRPDEVETCYGHAAQAKHLIKGRRDRFYAFYDEVDPQEALERHRLVDNFMEAVNTRQFEVWYQPKYDTDSEQIIGAEALVRWRRPDGTLVPPGKFIPIFEKNGNIAVLDEYVFRTVCEDQMNWSLLGHELKPVSVNISRNSLYYKDVVNRYQAILTAYGLEPGCVQLEITESATVENTEIAGLIRSFHDAGFCLLLDDFGSGYSSLASLNTLQFDILKLDKSLIDYIGNDGGEKLLCFIAQLAHSLGLHITAEGVETQMQLVFLRQLRCDDIQGYYFSKPLPKSEFEALILGAEAVGAGMA